VGGWLLVFWYGLTLIGPVATTCTMASDDAWRAVWLVGTPAGVAAVPLLWIGRRHVRHLRWLVLPYLGALLLVGPELLAELSYSTLRGGHLCDLNVLPDTYGEPAPWWHAVYPPVQLFLIATILGIALWPWHRDDRSGHSAQVAA
jgi:hypothetical protein